MSLLLGILLVVIVIVVVVFLGLCGLALWISIWEWIRDARENERD
jgi:uncharacterized membrane protein